MLEFDIEIKADKHKLVWEMSNVNGPKGYDDEETSKKLSAMLGEFREAYDRIAKNYGYEGYEARRARRQREELEAKKERLSLLGLGGGSKPEPPADRQQS